MDSRHMFPGMGDMRHAYAPLSAHLAAHGYTVACMDNRGHGDSSLLFDGYKYGDEAIAQDFINIALDFGKGCPAVLAGCSFSAGSATIAAGKRPDLVAGIILLAPFLHNPKGLEDAVAPFSHAGDVRQTLGSFSVGVICQDIMASEEKAAKRATASRTSLNQGWRWRAFQQIVKGLDHSVVRPWITKVNAPVLVLMGDKDPDWPNPMDEANWVVSNVKDDRSITVQGTGHAPMLECP
ncbi:hypothetical protein LTR84_004045 [Exophiala bonariae]|uniref:Serine aminopeptidase S33 domain-containing protein n=1 Tax=Exophiala bonariae TaxID=1690606 RepID=A0AAV9N8M6_9EURO|nr:hypothetical protein LTR84_004045 [Exophiala bonariae]